MLYRFTVCFTLKKKKTAHRYHIFQFNVGKKYKVAAERVPQICTRVNKLTDYILSLKLFEMEIKRREIKVS